MTPLLRVESAVTPVEPVMRKTLPSVGIVRLDAEAMFVPWTSWIGAPPAPPEWAWPEAAKTMTVSARLELLSAWRFPP